MKLPGRTLLIVIALFIAGPCAAAGTDGTLYRQLGERAGIARIVDRAFELYQTDDRTKDQFDNINGDWFKPRLTDQLCQLSGGPCIYKGRDMHAAHKGLHVTIAQFNALVEDLQTAMDQARIPFWTQNRLLAILAPMERDVVTR